MNDTLPDIHFNPDTYARREEIHRKDVEKRAYEVLRVLQEKVNKGEESVEMMMPWEVALCLIEAGYDVERLELHVAYRVWAKGAPNSPSKQTPLDDPDTWLSRAFCRVFAWFARP
jgi:hypothetical protein